MNALVAAVVSLLLAGQSPGASTEQAYEREQDREELRSMGLPADAFTRAEADAAVRASHARYAAAGGRAALPVFARAWVRTAGFTRRPEYGRTLRQAPAWREIAPTRVLLALTCQGTSQLSGGARQTYTDDQGRRGRPPTGPTPWSFALMIDAPSGEVLGGWNLPRQVLWATADEVQFMPDRGDLEHSVNSAAGYDRRTRRFTTYTSSRNVITGATWGFSGLATCTEHPLDGWAQTWRRASANGSR